MALQILFVWDAAGDAAAGVAEEVAAGAAEGLADADMVAIDDEVLLRAKTMAGNAWEIREASDAWVSRLAPQWPTGRQPGVDRNILRLAVWELTSGDTPPKVVLDESIELAKEFSTNQSASFINGVMDAVLKEHLKVVGG